MNLKLEIDRLGKIVPWYHRFELEGEVIEGWKGIYPVWEQIRHVREGTDYSGKRVLDLGSRDGMWAFEAEKLGASVVVATDKGCEGYHEHILFIKSVLKSKVKVFFNAPVEDVHRRLDCFFEDDLERFDIVQHLGLLYHLEDPLLSLRQVHKCIKTGGTLLLETAYYRQIPTPVLPVALFNCFSDVYSDPTTHWAFNFPALKGALKQTGFQCKEYTISTLDQSELIGRVCLTATAI